MSDNEETPLERIDWTDEKTAELKSFLQGHVAAMVHCDEVLDEHGLCECIHRLADWWAERQLELERLQKYEEFAKSIQRNLDCQYTKMGDRELRIMLGMLEKSDG